MNAIDFECPECGAKPGVRCHTLTGKATPVSHAKRKQAVLEQEHVRENMSQTTARTAGKATKD
jgi:hypothetical protein